MVIFIFPKRKPQKAGLLLSREQNTGHHPCCPEAMVPVTAGAGPKPQREGRQGWETALGTLPQLP